MIKKYREQFPEVDDITVKLRPIFGVQPKIYLAALFVLLLGSLLFFLFLFPGIVNNGTRITFTSSPEGAAVYVDQRWVGAAPCTVFIPSGTHTILVERPHFAGIQEEREVGGRLLGSLFFPRQERITYELEMEDPRGLLTSSIQEYQQWALTEPSGTYHIPDVLGSMVDTFIAANRMEGQEEAIRDVFYLALTFLQNDVNLRDFLGAYTAFLSGASVFSHVDLMQIVSDYLSLIDRYPNYAYFLLSVIPVELQQEISESVWFDNYRQALAEGAYGFTYVYDEPAPAGRVINDSRFVGIPGAHFMMGVDPVSGNPSIGQVESVFPHRQEVSPLLIGSTEVTNREYSEFIAANPEWAPENRDSLVNRGLVSSSYLNNWEDGEYPAGQGDFAVQYTSLYSARAFCDWYTEAYLDQGLQARLPSEAEWEWAARYIWPIRITGFSERAAYQDVRSSINRFSMSDAGVEDMLYGLWEWTDTPYSPSGFALSSPLEVSIFQPTAFELENAVEYAVRGGAWLNKQEELPITVRGGQPPYWCTSYLGFRIVVE
ncbi:MAG: SUMF1/EgtB/PvdO family nonheme iron enzyme [Spirochaetia bacterium]